MKNAALVGIGLCALAAIIAGVALRAAQAQDKYDPRNVPETLMQEKLQQAQTMLAAIAIEDYERIGTSALKLKEISLDAQWVTAKSELYGVYGEEFRSSLNRIMQQVEKKNIDAVTVHFFHMVSTCVECHKSLRDGMGLASTAIPLRTAGPGVSSQIFGLVTPDADAAIR